jgi:nucleoid-associated protein YejK
MYWASQMDRSRVETVLTGQVQGQVYPDNQAAVFVIGAFFFSRRHELLDRLSPHFTANSSQLVQRLRNATDQREFLTSGRICAQRIRIAGTEYLLSELMDARDTTASTLFDDLMRSYPLGNVPPETRQAAHQLDLLVHGDLAS